MNTNWKIEAGMAQQKFDLLLGTVTPPEVYSTTMAGIHLTAQHVAPPTGSNILHIKWDLSATEAPVPAMYELEWVYSDDYQAAFSSSGASISTSISTKSVVNYDFRDNATRITTNKTSYDIPLVYKRGYISYRVRMLRPESNLYQTVKYSPWSNTTDSGRVGTGDGFYPIANPHLGDNTNWNYESSFAEEGKSKQVLGYFDGLLKSRQTLTRFSSRPTELIGAEKFYDYEGRVGLQTLPVPVANHPELSYLSNFTLNGTTAQPYKAADIDPITPIPLAALSTSAAAHTYYSSSNTLLGATGYSMIKALPDAEGYPLLQTHYDPDDPGRVRVQGGAGKELQLGKGHETSYYYSDPSQDEVDAYFGANIGAAKYYEKVVTRDPNKELSFSVSDNTGKPVMTGLMGFPDTANSTTLLNVDGVEPPSGNPTYESLFYGHPPTWNGTEETFSKTFFKEATGGSIKYTAFIAPFAPCWAGANPIQMAVPIQYGLTVQGEGQNPQVIIPTTTASPGGGSAPGPVVSAAPVLYWQIRRPFRWPA